VLLAELDAGVELVVNGVPNRGLVFALLFEAFSIRFFGILSSVDNSNLRQSFIYIIIIV